MSALSILRDWRDTVHRQLLPDLHGHQAKALADLSFGMTLAQHCHSGRVAANVPGKAKPVSVQRRWERTLANPHLEALPAMRQMASHWLEQWQGRPLLLILDETPQRGTELSCMKLSAAYRRRSTVYGRKGWAADEHRPSSAPRGAGACAARCTFESRCVRSSQRPLIGDSVGHGP